MNLYVTLLYDPNWVALDWAKKYCPSYITNDVHQNGYNTHDTALIDYFFGTEADRLLFILKWK